MFWLLCLRVDLVFSVFFYVPANQEKFFTEDTSSKQYLIVHFEISNNPLPMPCTVSIKDPKGFVVVSKRSELKTPGKADRIESGKVAHLTTMSGEHRIYLQCTGSKWFNNPDPVKWTLTIDVQSDYYDLGVSRNVVKKEDVENAASTLKKLVSRVKSVEIEGDYERYTEQRTRQNGEQVAGMVIYMNLIGIASIAIVGILQTYDLQKYFKREKIY
jgi:emp24/gp25L/p24 family/GOLD